MNDLDEMNSPNAQQQLFERAVQGLDPGTANRLRLARRAAQAHGAPRRAWAPALATAALLLLGLAWWLPQRAPTPAPKPPLALQAASAPDAVDVAIEDDDADLYAWLGEAPVAADSTQGQRL